MADTPEMQSPTGGTSPTAPVTPAAPPPGTKSDNTKAIVTLVLGILSIVCCGFFAGIPAIFLGRSELKAIDEGRSQEQNRNLAKIGFILGIVGTILSILATLAYIGIIVLAIITGQSTGGGPETF
jgi:small-conductance mechanosensitive channel